MIALAESDVSIKKKEAWAKWFRQAFYAAGYKSQEDFAEAAHCSRVQVQRWLAGDARPREDSMDGLVEALKTVATPREVYNAAGHTYPEEAPLVTILPKDRPPLSVQRDGRVVEYATKEDVQEIKDLLEQILRSGLLPGAPLPPAPDAVNAPSDPGLSDAQLAARIKTNLTPTLADAKRQTAEREKRSPQQEQTQPETEEKDAPRKA